MNPIYFNHAELNWLQSNLQGWGEMKWPGSRDVQQFDSKEHQWLQNLLTQVRTNIGNLRIGVTFDLPVGLGPEQHNWIEKWLIDYKGNSGEYIFQGPYGTSLMEGDQFPTGTGSANQNFTGQGDFPENSYYEGADIFNSILQKLGAPQYPPPPAEYSSPGGD